MHEGDGDGVVAQATALLTRAGDADEVLRRLAVLLVPHAAAEVAVVLGAGGRVALHARWEGGALRLADGEELAALEAGPAEREVLRTGAQHHVLGPAARHVVALRARGSVLGALRLSGSPAAGGSLDPAVARQVGDVCALALAATGADGLGTALEAFARAVPIGLSLTDDEDRHLFANEQFAALDGVRAHDHAGRRVEEVLADPVGAASAAVRRQVRATGRPLLGQDLDLPGPDGASRAFVASYVPVELGDGRVGCGGVVADVTERRRAQEALEASEARLRTLVQTAPDAILGVDAEGRIIEANARIEVLLGFRPDEVVGRPLEMLVPERFRKAHVSHRGHYVAHPTTRPMGAGRDLFARHRDGHEVPVEISLGSTQTPAGTFTTAVIVDITERRRAEAALRESEERFRVAFEHAPIGVALVTPRRPWSVLQANPALGELFGVAAGDLVGVRVLTLLEPDELAAAYAALERLLSGRSARETFEARLLRVGGEGAWASMSLSLAFHADGSPGHLILQVQDVSERKRFEGQLQHLADHDPLTGLFNRRRFEEELARALGTARRYDQPAAVLVVDLDDFKAVNDEHGHAAGDELLAQVAATLRGRLRDTDVVGRLGGDEFAVVLPQTDDLRASLVAAELVTALGAVCTRAAGDGTARATASIGVAVAAAAPWPEPDELLVRADLAMYEAKEDGRNRAAVADPADGQRHRLRARVRWTQRIQHALEHERFVLLRQPIVDLARGRVDRHELLLRLRDDDGDLVPPGAFLPVAEQSGQIREIDRWVVGQAVGMLERFAREGRRDVLEVNLSGASLTDRHTMDAIVRQVAAAPIDRSRLVLEVTETAAIVNVARAREFAGRLYALGCQFALDDFGSGFGSFYYLKHLPFDSLKIDGDFIRELPTSPRDQLTVKAIVDIARGLGKTTIAEYVQDAPTLDLLAGLGVDFAQGFHVGRPQPLPVELVEASRGRSSGRFVRRGTGGT